MATPLKPGSTGSAQAAGLPPFGLVGGGGVTPRAGTGKLAVTGSIGDVLFAEDGTALDSSAMKVITAAAQDIRQHQVSTVTVIGTPTRSATPRLTRSCPWNGPGP